MKTPEFLVIRMFRVLILFGAIISAHAETALFIGNSYTYGAGDKAVQKLGVPGLVAAIAEAKGRHLDAASVTKGGKDLGYHLAQPETSAAISAKTRDWLVLQDLSTKAVQPGGMEAHLEQTESLYHLFRTTSPKGSVVLYQTWPRGPLNTMYRGAADGPAKMFASIKSLYAASAKKLEAIDPGDQIRIAPVGEAFVLCMARHPEINLYSEDNHHASAAGSYLSSLVLYATLFSDAPTGATRVFSGLEIAADQAAILQGIANEVTASPPKK
jgi:hypothetical protein